MFRVNNSVLVRFSSTETIYGTILSIDYNNEGMWLETEHGEIFARFDEVDRV
jgi:hypothetical protein